MTNADCIRRMTDEQLYDFLSEWECGDIDYSITFCDLCKQGGNELNLDCDGCRKHWLQRDATDFGGLMYWKRNTTFNADTPQTDCENCAHWEHGAGQHYYCALLEMRQECCFESKDESTLMFANVPQTDCGWGEPNE